MRQSQLPRVDRIGCRAVRPQLPVMPSLQRALPLRLRQHRPACVEAHEGRAGMSELLRDNFW